MGHLACRRGTGICQEEGAGETESEVVTRSGGSADSCVNSLSLPTREAVLDGITDSPALPGGQCPPSRAQTLVELDAQEGSNDMSTSVCEKGSAGTSATETRRLAGFESDSAGVRRSEPISPSLR